MVLEKEETQVIVAEEQPQVESNWVNGKKKSNINGSLGKRLKKKHQNQVDNGAAAAAVIVPPEKEFTIFYTMKEYEEKMKKGENGKASVEQLPQRLSLNTAMLRSLNTAILSKLHTVAILSLLQIS